MLEKFLNREVIIEEKLYQYASTISESPMARMAVATQNRVSGTITAIDENFIELDHTSLIARKFIYRIIMK